MFSIKNRLVRYKTHKKNYERKDNFLKESSIEFVIDFMMTFEVKKKLILPKEKVAIKTMRLGLVEIV